MAVAKEREDVCAEPDLGVGILALSVEQRLALPGVESDATNHGYGFRVLDMCGSIQLYRIRPRSPLRGAISMNVVALYSTLRRASATPKKTSGP